MSARANGKRLVKCAKCGALVWFFASTPHAPRWVAGVLVDCAGKAVTR